MDLHKHPSASTDSAGRRNKRPMYEEDSSEEFGDDDDAGEIKAGKNWSSARKVNMIVSKFGELKKNLVRNIGFGGILDLPLFNKVDRKFTLWLLSRIDCLRRVIVVNGEDQTDIIDLDVKRILGIPCGSMAVCGLNSDELAMEFEFRNLKSAELVVKKDYPDGMDKIEMDKFKVAFVVFVMGTFLAPTCKYNAVNPDFFGSLVKPDDINQYNWSAYVLDHLMQAAARVQDDLRSKRDVSNITGCSLLIQIIYLESLRIAPSMRPGKGSPRVKAYDCETMRKMILTDKASSSGYTDNASWGCSQVRHRKVSTPQASRIPISSTIGQNIQTDHSSPCQRPNPESNDLIQSMNTLPKKLSDILHQLCGSKLSPQQVSALRWYYAKTTRLLNQLKVSLISEQIVLIEKLAGGAAENSQDTTPEEPMKHNRTNSGLQDGYASGTESATEVVQPRQGNQATMQQNISQMQNSPTLSLGPDQNGSHDGHKAEARPSNSAPLLTLVGSFRTPIAATRPALSSMSTGHNWAAPSFDLGIDDVDVPPDDALIPNLPHPHDPNGSSNSQMVVGSVCINSKTPPTSQCPTPVLNALEVCTHISASKVSVNQVLDTPAKAIAVATPLSTKLTKECTANQTPEHFIRNSSVTPAELTEIMSFGGVFARILESESPSNKNSCAWDEEFTDVPPIKHTLVEGKIVKSHWFFGYEHPRRQNDILLPLWNSLCASQPHQLGRLWIQHHRPKPIKISGHSFKEIICNGSAMSYEFCDIAMRRLNQLDSTAYPDGANVRWRHFLESDFAMFAIAGEHTWKSKSIQNQFIGEQITYQLNRCRMIIIPALVTLTWCCYIFDFKEKCIHIVDPTFRPGSESIMDQMHEHSAAKLQAALANCIQEFFNGWSPDWNHWSRKYVPAMAANCTTMESGIRTIIAARDYDGNKLVYGFSMPFLEDFKKAILYEMLSLKGNQAKLPSSYIHSLDD